MRLVIQRCLSGGVSVDGEVKGSVQMGYVVLAGVGAGDTDADAVYCAEKLTTLRVFEDPQGKMNLAIAEVGGSVLAVSQFTLYGDARGQRRPSFITAARPDEGERLFDLFVECVRARDVRVETGVFGTHMIVHIENDGPVTILIDSKKAF